MKAIIVTQKNRLKLSSKKLKIVKQLSKHNPPFNELKFKLPSQILSK
jgi:hypothetical protein